MENDFTDRIVLAFSASAGGSHDVPPRSVPECRVASNLASAYRRDQPAGILLRGRSLGSYQARSELRSHCSCEFLVLLRVDLGDVRSGVSNRDLRSLKTEHLPHPRRMLVAKLVWGPPVHLAPRLHLGLLVRRQPLEPCSVGLARKCVWAAWAA